MAQPAAVAKFIVALLLAHPALIDASSSALLSWRVRLDDELNRFLNATSHGLPAFFSQGGEANATGSNETRAVAKVDVGDIKLHAESRAAISRANSSSRVSRITCGTTFKEHPDEVSCPSDCPFIRNEPTHICHFSCVTSDKCGEVNPLTNYANPETMKCGVCNVVACQACGTNSKSCAVCHEDFYLQDGQCYQEGQYVQWLFYMACVGIGVFLVAYLVTLALRPTVNTEVLQHAIEQRAFSKTRNEATGELYSLWLTNLRDDYVSGVGVMLHFRFQSAAVVYAVILLVLTYLISLFFQHRPEIMKHTLEEDAAFSICDQDVRAQEHQVTNMEIAFFFLVVLIYIFSFVAAIAFAVHQRRFSGRESDILTTMQDYVIVVTGLPRLSGTEPVEENLKKFFSDTFADSHSHVIGVSVSWDYRVRRDDVQDQIRWEIDSREKQWHAANVGARPEPPSQPGETDNIPAVFKRVDALLGFGPPAPEDDDGRVKPEDKTKKEVRAMLESFYTSHTAFIVFASEGDRNRALKQAKESPVEFRGVRLKLSKQDVEPEVVLWENHGIRSSEFIMNMGVGILLLILAVFLLDTIFYFPSVSYLMTMSDVVGMTSGGIWGCVMGGLVAISNQIIYALIGMIADKMGFLSRDGHQRFYVICYTAAVFFNTMIDLFVVLLLAQGYTMEQAVEMQTNNDSSMSTKAIAENPSMQRSIYVQYYAYIIPCCLLAPYFAEPFVFTGFYYLSKWLVRSRTDVDAQQAEDALRCAPFDLSRYGDISINTMLCVGLLAFTYRDLHTVFFWLLVSLVWLYGWDTVRFLRYSARSSFVTSKMDETAHILCAMPCAILASCIAFRLYSFKNNFTDDLQGLMDYYRASEAVDAASTVLNRDTIVVIMLMAGAGHLFVHLYVLTKYVPEWGRVEVPHQEDVQYSDKSAEMPCNWFNANPIFCLRAKYFYEYRHPCHPFCVGKEFILEVNPALGQHYEHAPPLPDNDKTDFSQVTHLLNEQWTTFKSNAYVQRLMRAGSHDEEDKAAGNGV